MKHALALHTALACALVLPAVTIVPRQDESIGQTLLRTVRALEHLAGLQQELGQTLEAEGDPKAIATVLEWTEQPLAEGEEREQLLVDLRDEVNRLQGEYDLIRPDEPLASAPQDGTGYALPDPEEQGVPAAPTTGLDESMRRLLATIREPVPEHRSTIPAAQTSARARPREAFEPEGYTADGLRLARVRYRQGRWQETVDILARASDVESVYLRGRALERLERHAEALADYRAVMAMPDAGTTAERAREDSEFLEWRQSFTKKLAGAKPK